MKKTYAEKLKDPRWQKKRLEVMQQAGFECEECGDKESTLNVHHGMYQKGREPWEYPDGSFSCLCDECHKSRHEAEETLLIRKSQMSTSELQNLAGYALGLYSQYFPEYAVIKVSSFEEAIGLGDFCEVQAERIVERLAADWTIKMENLEWLKSKGKRGKEAPIGPVRC